MLRKKVWKGMERPSDIIISLHPKKV